MDMALEFKPDLGQSLERFEAWWHGEIVDRPPVTLWAPGDKPYRGPVSTHATLRDRWLDVRFNVEQAAARLEASRFLGDALPVYMPNIGPELTSTVLGAPLEFGEHTSWSVPTVHDVAQWDEVAARPFDFDNTYWRAIEAMTDLALEVGRGRFLVGVADLHGNLDILAGLREPQMLCLDLMDDLPRVARALDHAVDGYVECFRRGYGKLAAAGQVATTWTPTLHAGPAYVPSSDFWCMLSDEMARDLVLPAIVKEMAPLGRSIFHLDGPQALRHLDLLLQLPELDAVQWVFGAGQGPAAKWMDVYRQCRAAGKSVQVLADTADDALAVLDAVGPRGVWLCVGEGFKSAAEAEAYLREVERRCVAMA